MSSPAFATITQDESASSQRNRISLFAVSQRHCPRKSSIGMDAAFRLGSAAPAAGARIFAGRGSAACTACTRPIDNPMRQVDAAAGRPTRRSPRSPAREMLANGLNFNLAPSASTTGIAARRPPWKRLRPLIQAPNGASARASGSTLRMRQQASGSVNHNSRSGSSRDSVLLERLDRAHVAQAERRDQRVAIGQRFLEQPAGIEKNHRDRRIDIGHEFEQRAPTRCRTTTPAPAARARPPATPRR